MNSTAVFTVIFPKNIIYFDDFLKSINEQTCKDFDLFIINDGIDNKLLKDKLSKIDCNYKICDIKKGLSIPEIREFGISQLFNQDYENIIFADSDDLMSTNRVEYSILRLIEYPIVFNDLSSINSIGILQNEHLWESRLKDKIINKSFLLDKNVIGLGNSAVKKSLLIDLKIPKQLIAVDWYIYSKIIKDFEAAFIRECVTFYRQHDLNVVGVSKDNNISRLNYILKVKEIHYQSLSQNEIAFKPYLLKVRDQINKLNQLKEIDLSQLNNKNINFFWWEESNYLQHGKYTINN